jgi:hypothetical protein
MGRLHQEAQKTGPAHYIFKTASSKYKLTIEIILNVLNLKK